MGEGEGGWFWGGQSLQGGSECSLDWWWEAVKEFVNERRRCPVVSSTWLSSLGNGANGHLEVYSGFQHTRRMARSLLLVLPCI